MDGDLVGQDRSWSRRDGAWAVRGEASQGGRENLTVIRDNCELRHLAHLARVMDS